MKPTEANQINSGYRLNDELARFCLPEADRDPNRKLAWTNSVCLIFLLIGIFGARRGFIFIKPVPPLSTAIPIIVEPTVLPPQPTVEKKTTDDEKPEPQPIAVVLPQMPNINFSVPTIGALVVPANLAAAPPLEPMRAKNVVAQIGSIDDTGADGDRPAPPYPKIAMESAQQGTVVLTLNGDASGNVISVALKESSGFPILDRAAMEFVKRHWHLPFANDNQIFETKIIYKLQLN